MSNIYFDEQTFSFLKKLSKNNNHEWFRAHKEQYEEHVRSPALQLIRDLQPDLLNVSDRFVASEKKVGGSLFRVMKDTRFDHPEGPYKTWIGLRFFHERKNDVHAPSFYVHISSHGSYMGGGLWKPQPSTLRQVREFLVNNPQSFRAAVKQLEQDGYTWSGEQITRLPRGYEEYKDLQDELKMKSFTWNKRLADQSVSSTQLHQTLAQHFNDLGPMVDYLCASLNLDF